MVAYVKEPIIFNFILLIFFIFPKEFLNTQVQEMRNIQNLHDVCHKSALDNIFQKELRSLKELCTELQLEIIYIFLCKVIDEARDSSSLSNRNKQSVNDHIKELFEHIVSMPHRFVLLFFKVRCVVHEGWDENKVK